MKEKTTNKSGPSAEENLGIEGLPLCREPWESYYILRRGILPCCHGSRPIAPMSEWETAWNSPELQEIRDYLRRGKLSPYCMSSLSCPIVQKYLAQKRKKSRFSFLDPTQRSPFFRFLNRIFFGLPAKIFRVLFRQ
ncbi:MAG: hypothetical protein JXB26_09050 [Candidatus Aminicenantes bacterium]|nr:hypothetical protein [Candidatus Aminicenantes bacterium]